MNLVRSMTRSALVVALLMTPLAASSQTRVPSSLGASKADSVPVRQGVAPIRATRASPAGSMTVDDADQMSNGTLQSVVSKRETRTRLITDVMSGSNKGMQQATNDIGGDGGRPPCPNCAKARRAAR